MAGQPRERADAAENRRRILAAARDLTNERGARALTMQAVASAAGVGKATVFHRFSDRAGLLGALLDDYMTELQDAFLHGPPPLGPGAAAEERLEAFLAELVHRTVANLGAALAGESLTSSSDPPPAYGSLRLHLTLLITEIDPELPAGALAAYLLNAVAPSVLDRMLSSGETSTELADAARALVRGITRRDRATSATNETASRTLRR